MKGTVSSWRKCEKYAAVVQLVECLPSKEKVAGSNPVRRSKNIYTKVNKSDFINPFKTE